MYKRQLLDRKRNEDIRRELNIVSLHQKIEEHRRRWCEHLNRMVDIRLPVAALGYHPTGKRDVGRPSRRWVPEQTGGEGLILEVVMMMTIKYNDDCITGLIQIIKIIQLYLSCLHFHKVTGKSLVSYHSCSRYRNILRCCCIHCE